MARLASLLPFLALSLYQSANASPASTNGQALLAQAALGEILSRAAPIAGRDEGCSKSLKTCDWMAKFPDSTQLVHMNLPGTHDAATWNYSDATQASLLRYTGSIPSAETYRCQEHSLLQSLNEGVRVFDLRYAYNPGNDTIGFHHSKALLAPHTTLEDVLFGLYSWLDKHPTEAVLVSMNYEGGTGTPNDAALQEHLYNVFQSDLAKKYWLQTNGTLGTLGQARGKLTLLQRFTYTLIPSTSSKRIGIALDAAHWTDNGKAIELVYNQAKNQVAYIEDYYYMDTLPTDAGTAANVELKYNTTVAHLQNATMYNRDQLYISFASASHNDAVPQVSPKVMAVGDGKDVGVNQKLLPWFKANKGKRFGIVMLDFYDAVPGLVEAIIGV
ncbi:PLC-like phosphodiesterase [Lyophyllum atratum]|nr:PLC-like phosphodiesterase [Lyophyllum atratum]